MNSPADFQWSEQGCCTELNLPNRIHASEHVPYFKEAAVMQSWMCEVDSRTHPSEDLGADLATAHVSLPVQADSIKPLSACRAVVTTLWEGGWGPKQWLMCTQNVRPAHLSSLHFHSSRHLGLSLPFVLYLNISPWIHPNYETNKHLSSYSDRFVHFGALSFFTGCISITCSATLKTGNYWESLTICAAENVYNPISNLVNHVKTPQNHSARSGPLRWESLD